VEGNNGLTSKASTDSKGRRRSKAKVDRQFPPAAFAGPEQELDATMHSAEPRQVGHEIETKEPIAFGEYNSVYLAATGGIRVARPEKVAECPRVAQIRRRFLRPVASRVILEGEPGGLSESHTSNRQQAPDHVITFAKKYGRLEFEVDRGKAHQRPMIRIAYAKLSCHRDRIRGKGVAQWTVAQQAPQGHCEVIRGHGVAPTLRVPRPSPLRLENPCHVPE
jgi:hypothetical protein